MRKNKQTVKRGSKALEMTMRDVFDGLEDISNSTQYNCAPETVQILSIESPETDTGSSRKQLTNIYSISNPPILHRSKDVVSFLLEREQKCNTPLSA